MRLKYLYHGTTSDCLDDILQYGLTCRLQDDDDWSGNFVTSDPTHAYQMALEMRDRHNAHGKTIVLRINRQHSTVKGARLDHGTAGVMQHGHQLPNIMRHPRDYFSFRLPQIDPDAIVGVLSSRHQVKAEKF
jgi:hypothetical protein